MTEHTSESRDGTGAGDHDTPYSWGVPAVRLDPRAQAKLALLKNDIRNGAHQDDLARGPQAGSEPPDTEEIPLG